MSGKRDRKFTKALLELSGAKKRQRITSNTAAAAHGLAGAARTNSDTLLRIPSIRKSSNVSGLLAATVGRTRADATWASILNSRAAQQSNAAESAVRETPSTAPKRRFTVANVHQSPHPSGHRRSRSS